ncbi:MAG: thiamine pyrophosphate-dependent dehydrogenase E1 component subunit alpha [Polyangiales bacterium]
MQAELFRAIYLIRRVEEEVARIYPSDKIKSPVHLSIGQEGVSVAICKALRDDDVVFGTYRGHAAYLAKGGDLNALIAELYGKATGCTKGKGGSMHLADPAHGVMGTSAVVGTTIPHAVGFALARRLQRKPSVVVSFFGDGAVDEGAFHESVNFAALQRLPVLFVCENNFYAIHSPLSARRPDNLCERARSYGITAERFEDGDVMRLYRHTQKVCEQLRSGVSGPVLFEVLAYRQREHVGPGEDFHTGYRSREEAAVWRERDPVTVAGAKLDPQLRAAITAEVEQQLKAAFEHAEQSPFPALSELTRDVLGEPA